MSLSYNGTELQSITWNGADLQSVTMDGVEVWSASRPIGICLVQTGGGSGTWQRIDANGAAVSGFSNTKPWTGIHDVTVDGQAMVWIPKFYLKTGTFTSGTYNRKKYWIVSSKSLPGYRVHPAFVHNGVEKDGFYIGKYFAYVDDNSTPGSAAGHSQWNHSAKLANIRNLCNARNDGSVSGAKAGWHLKTIYEWAAIQLLCLIELGTPDADTVIGHGWVTTSGGSNAKWRGICDMWGSYGELTDGVYGDTWHYYLLNKTNDGTYSQFSPYVSLSSSGTTYQWIANVYNDDSTDYNLGDIFWPIGGCENQNDGSFNAGYLGMPYGDIDLLTCGYRGSDYSNLFVFYITGDGSSAGFRLAKYDI